MKDRKTWDKIIKQARNELDFNDPKGENCAHGGNLGYKMVFGPWSTLFGLDTAFLSIYPSKNYPVGADLELISEERGNTFEIELDADRENYPGRLSINEQFIRLADFIARKPVERHKPIEILTGVAIPFRVENWNEVPNETKRIARDLCGDFWTEPLTESTIKLIIVSGNEPYRLVNRIFDMECISCIDSEYHLTAYLRRYSTSCGKTVVQLPYLGKFKLFDKPDCEGPVRSIFDGFCDPEYRWNT